ncbi:twin-arginine translocation signal domain-containing protein [Algoriphagus halophilus]
MNNRREFLKKSALASLLMGMGFDISANPYQKLHLKVGAVIGL